MDEGTKPASLPPSHPPSPSSAPFLSLQTPPMGRARASQLGRSIALARRQRKKSERTSLKFISQAPPPPPMLPPLALARGPPSVRPPARRCRRRCRRRRFGKQKESRVGRFGPQRSQSPSPSLSRPSCPKGTRLTHSPRRDGDGGSNFWMERGGREGDLLWRAMAMARRVLLLK